MGGMFIDQRMRAIASAVASGWLALALIYIVGGSTPTSDWIFPALIMLLGGWGTIFNLLVLGSDRQSGTFTLNYPNDGREPDRSMSPRASTILLAVFWVNGALLLAAVAG